jgi:hypothetical protein
VARWLLQLQVSTHLLYLSISDESKGPASVNAMEANAEGSLMNMASAEPDTRTYH